MIPPGDLFIQFVIVGLALNVTPGADMTYVASVAARDGWRFGIIASLGIAAGCLAHVTMAVLGLSSLIIASPVLFTFVRYAGAAYLAYIAIGILRGGAAKKTAQFPPVRSIAIFRQGLLVNVLNPKVGIFFLAFLPQFVDPKHGPTGMQLLTLGLIFNFNGTIVNSLVSVIAAHSARRLGSFSMAARFARWSAGSLLLYFAFRTLGEKP